MLGEFVSVVCELAENNPARQRTRIETGGGGGLLGAYKPCLGRVHVI